jgi:hypothetical protein
MKNIWQKIAEARAKISVKKNGWNKHGSYNYYQLDDIYSESRKVFNELGLVTVPNMSKQAESVPLTLKYNTYDEKKQKHVNFKDVTTPVYTCILDVINADSPEEKIAFSLDIPYSQQDGASFAQSLGGTMTYATKYLYLALLMLDDTQDDDAKNEHKNEPIATTKQEQVKDSAKTYLADLLKQGGLNNKEIGEFVKEHTGKSKITDKEADDLYKKIISGEIVITNEPEDDIPNEQCAPPQEMKKHRRV